MNRSLCLASPTTALNNRASCLPRHLSQAPVRVKQGCQRKESPPLGTSACITSVLAYAQLSQAASSWGLEWQAAAAPTDDHTDAAVHSSTAGAVPVVLLVDGTNLGCICAGSRSSQNHNTRTFRESTEERFKAWLQFLAAFTNSPSSSSSNSNSSCGPLAAVLVAFDNKGSVLTNARAQVLPAYLSKRYSHQSSTTSKHGTGLPAAAASMQAGQRRAGTGSAALSGWAQLAGVLDQLNTQQELQELQEQQFSTSIHASCSYLAAHAAYGLEADDVIAAAVQWCRGNLDPAPIVIIASSDSDMQQLLDDNTYWLELTQVASAQHPSGLALHSAASFRRAFGFEPAAYPDYLALVGKKEASIPSVGVSSKLAKTLLAKFGSLEGILASQDALKAFGAAHKLLGQGQAGADVRRNTAATNLAVLRMRPQQQLLPTQQLQDCYSHALDALRQQQQIQPQLQPCSDTPAPQQQQQLSLLHPARRLHMQQCQPYLSALQDCLYTLGLQHQVAHYASPNGLWCDLLVQLPSSMPAAAAGDSRMTHPHQTDQQQQQQQRQPVQGGSSRPAIQSGDGIMVRLQSEDVSAGGGSGVGWLAFQIFGPADLSSGVVLPLNAAGWSYADAVQLLGQQLAAECGCFKQGTSALGHPKKSLLKAASGGAKRQLTLLKGLGIPLVVVPFYELADAVDAGSSGDIMVGQQQVELRTGELQLLEHKQRDGGRSAHDQVVQYVQALLQSQGVLL